MTKEEFKDLNLNYNITNAKPSPFMEWQRAYNRIYPHLSGEMPTAILEAFPNESVRQFEYRKANHRSQTQSKLNQAIANVKRIVMQGSFTLNWGVEMSEWVKIARFEGFEFLSFFFNIVYPFRVGDPNGLIAVIPQDVAYEGEQQDPKILSERKKVEIQLFEFDKIKVFKKDLIIVQKSSNVLYSFEPNVFTVIYLPENAKDEPTLFYFEHEAGLLAYPLGGMPQYFNDAKDNEPRIYFVSDFDFAVPSMDNLERLNNLEMSSFLTVAFPIRVTKDLDCDVCGGKGEVAKRNLDGSNCLIVEKDPETNREWQREEWIVCADCKGKGTLSLSSLDNINIPKDTDIFGKDANNLTNIANAFVGYVAPPTDIFTLQNEKVKEANLECDRVLNITKQANNTESGAAKEKDREGLYTQLKGIADSMLNLMTIIALDIINIRYISQFGKAQKEQELTAFSVIANDDYALRSAEDVQMAMLTNLDKKPVFIRQGEYLEYLNAQYKTTPKMVLAAKIAFDLTNGNNRRTPDELRNLLLQNVITESDVRKAINSEIIILRLLEEDRSMEQIAIELDEIIESLAPKSPIELE